MIVGWALVWNYATKLNQAAEQELKVAGKPEPVVADQSIEFETVTDRTPMGFRDNAAYSLLLERRARRNGRRARRRCPPRRLAHPSLGNPEALPRRADPHPGHRPARAALSVQAQPERTGSTKHG